MVGIDSDQTLELTYQGVFIHHRNHVIIPTIVDEFADDNRDHALVYHFIDNDWAQHLIDDNSVCGVVAINEPTTKILNMGVDGRVNIAEIGGGRSTEFVDTSNRGPNYSETLRCVRVIEGHVYVAGMARQIYRRERPGYWIRSDADIYSPRGQRTKSIGILDIDGGEESLFAVGYKGEVWFFDGKKWVQEDSITNIALTCVKYVSQNQVYIAGLAGTIIQGTHGNWRAIIQEQTDQDFWGMTEFKGSLYLSNYDGVFVLENDHLDRVNFGIDRSFTTAYLHSADGVMWSVGHKDLFFTEDGSKWVYVEKP